MYLGNAQLATTPLASSGSGGTFTPPTIEYDADATVTIKVQPSVTIIHVRPNR